MDRRNLTLDIRADNIGAKRVNVRGSLTAGNLIATVKDKFNLDGEFQLTPAGASAPLPPETPLDQAGVEDGSTLLCVRLTEATGTLDAIRAGERHEFSKAFKRVWLVEDSTLTEYDLTWQPAVIGRKDHRNPMNNRLLAVDLEPVEELPTVSRHHACITEKRGQFFLEDIQGRNPVYLDGAKLRQGAQYPLTAGHAIQVGRVRLTFNLMG
ncbi:MAG TPA: FHA domain-containing protein [Anaerolineales bacterium]|nr:FHA domain-containing protein [Anaerolineales bacterium]